MDLRLITVILQNKGVQKKWLADQIGMTYQNLSRCIKENKIQAQDLEKISTLLDVPISKFFNDNIPDIDSQTHTEQIGYKNKMNINSNIIKESKSKYKNKLAEKDLYIEKLEENSLLLKDQVAILKRNISLLEMQIELLNKLNNQNK